MGIIFKVTTDTVLFQLFYVCFCRVWWPISASFNSTMGPLWVENPVSVLWSKLAFQTNWLLLWTRLAICPVLIRRCCVIILMPILHRYVLVFLPKLQACMTGITNYVSMTTLTRQKSGRRLLVQTNFCQLCALMTTFTLCSINYPLCTSWVHWHETHSLGYRSNFWSGWQALQLVCWCGPSSTKVAYFRWSKRRSLFHAVWYAQSATALFKCTLCLSILLNWQGLQHSLWRSLNFLFS